MNIYQRIVLVAGAILLFCSVGATKTDFYGNIVYPANLASNVVIIIGPTLLIWWALSGIGKKNGK